MGIKSEIENNIILWFFASIIASFLSGVASYEGIIRIAKLEVVTQAEIKLLREEKSKFKELKEKYYAISSGKSRQIENNLNKFQRTTEKQIESVKAK